MSQTIRLAAITDEYSQDIAVAARAIAETGLTGAELRSISGRNIIDLTGEELDQVLATLRDHGLEVVSIASPLLKCTLPDAPEPDPRFERDLFGSDAGIEEQPRIAARAFEIARRAGARIVRVFSYWRTVAPERCFARIAAALGELAEQAARQDLTIALENEHACNVATGAETGALLKLVDHPNVKVVWDPANALVAGEERPFPEGYRRVPLSRIAHVHAKDCHVKDHKATWGPIGAGSIDWKGQIDALAADGYTGWISLETHWQGPDGDRIAGSKICGRILRELVGAV